MQSNALNQFQALEPLLNSLDILDQATLKETLAYIIKVYIITSY